MADAERQKIQGDLAFEAVLEGEAPRHGDEGPNRLLREAKPKARQVPSV